MYQGIKTVSFEEAVKVVKSGDRIHIHSVALCPPRSNSSSLQQRTCRRIERRQVATLAHGR